MKFILMCVMICYMWGMIQAHADHKEERMTRRHVEEHQRFARSCNKRSSSTCVLQAEVTEGPYYYDTQLVRQNITEGYQGIPMTLNISVVNTNTCEVVPNAAVDIWHCNAIGIYSHYQVINNEGGANTTFLRGIQLTDDNGNVSFVSIFPGWYQPRVIHIHVKVHVGGDYSSSGYTGGSVVHVGQLFVTDDVANTLKIISPYSSNTQALNTLDNDQVYPEAGSIALMDLSYTNFADGIFASIVLGVDVSSTTISSSTADASTTDSSVQSTSSSTSSSSSTSAASSTSSSSTSEDSTNTASSLYHLSFSLLSIIIGLVF